MTRRRCTGKALAERRRRAMQLHLAEFTQEETAEQQTTNHTNHTNRAGVTQDMSATVGGLSCLLPGDPLYSPNPWSVNEDGMWVDSAGMKFNPEPSRFDPRHPPLEKTMSLEETAASWKDTRIYDPNVDGYGPQLRGCPERGTGTLYLVPA